MTWNFVIQCGLYLIILLALAKPLGPYRARVYEGQRIPVLDRVLGPVERLIYRVTGSGFLKHMVRNIVGSLVEVGKGRRTPGWLAEVLEGKDRTKAGPTAPAHGLTLVEVLYGVPRPAPDEEDEGEDG